jgi:hypothetical protein
MSEVNFPKNETFKHFALKNIGSLYLKHNQLCNFVAEEFNIGFSIWSEAEKQFDWKAPANIQQKRVADAIGFKSSMYSNKKTTFKCIEAKQSLADFRNGFCIGGEYNYLIAPKNIIPVEEVPPFVGLIEIDFDKFRYNGKKIRGYNIKTRARKIKLKPEHKDDEVANVV